MHLYNYCLTPCGRCCAVFVAITILGIGDTVHVPTLFKDGATRGNELATEAERTTGAPVHQRGPGHAAGEHHANRRADGKGAREEGIHCQKDWYISPR